MSIYNHKKQYIFIHNPRTAGTSMEQHLGGGSHTTVYEFRKFINEETTIDWTDIFKFMFVRHPVERFRSAMAIKGGVTVDEVLDELEKENWNKRFIIFKPQHEMAKPTDLDFIGRYENLQEDWEIIQDKYDVGELDKLHPAKREKPILTSSQLERVLDIYNGDFVNFNYE